MAKDTKKKAYPFSIVKRAYLWLILCVVMITGSLLIFGFYNRLSIEFTGGIKVTVDGEINQEETKTLLTEKYIEIVNDEPLISFGKESNYSTVIVSLAIDGDDKVVELSQATYQVILEQMWGDESKIIARTVNGPSIGQFMKRSAIQAVIVGLLFMALYMLFAFSSIREVISPAILVVVTIVTMIFDVAIPIGAYGLLMAFDPSVTIDTIFIVALLTTMGYSINDTIIIFDRVRENTKKHQKELENKQMLYGEVFEISLWQTMRRSIFTSLSTLLVIIVMLLLGTGAIQMFAFTMGVGVLAGSFSSIFFAAPLAYLLLGKFKKEYKKL